MWNLSILPGVHSEIVDLSFYFMPDSTSDPERYSIDEMIDRLKTREGSDGKGQLVTRPDGSQAVRTRKRKRRSNQTGNKQVKRAQRLQLIQISGFVVVLLLTFLIASFGVLYANSSGYRERLIAKAEGTSGAGVALTQFRMNPARANAARLKMAWPKGSSLESLDVHGVVAKISPISFLGKKFKGEEMQARGGELILKAPTVLEMANYSPAAGKRSAFQFTRYSVSELNVFFGEGKSQGSMLEKTAASFFPSKVTGQGEIRLKDGIFKMDGWPWLKLERSFINVRDEELQVQSLRFKFANTENQSIVEKGSIDFSGVIRPREANSTQTLTATLDSFRLAHLLGDDLGRFFLGKVTTKDGSDKNFIRFKPGSGEQALLEVVVAQSTDSKIDVNGFRFLDSLSLALGDRWYEAPSFYDEVSATIRRQGRQVEINDINLEDRGRMALRGSIATDDAGQISGTFRVGLPDSKIESSRNTRLKTMFRESKDGYRWIDLTIGGSSAAPTDNFNEVYKGAIPIAPESVEGASEPDSVPPGLSED